MWLNSPNLQTQTGQEDNLLDELDAERTQVKQEDNIVSLWSVSCELFLNCCLLSALCRSNERRPGLSVHVHTCVQKNNHVSILLCF